MPPTPDEKLADDKSAEAPGKGDKKDTSKGSQTRKLTAEGGREVELPMEKFDDYARKGLDYETKMAEVKQQREAIEADKLRYKSYDELQAYLRANPQAAKAVSMALKDPDSVVNGGRGASDDDGDDEEQGARQSNAELSDVRSQLAQLQARQRESDVARYTSERRAAVESEIKAYPWLTGKRADLAKTTILAELQANPEEGVSSVATRVATAVKQALEEDQARDLQKNETRQRQVLEDPEHGIPSELLPEKPYTAKDLADGKCLKGALKALERLGGGR